MLGPESLAISFGGRSTELVRDDASGAYHPKDDDGSRVERLTDTITPPANGVDRDEHWKVTTLDGTQYFFGLNHLPGWAAGKTVTNSAWTAPVYGNNTGEPCHQATFDASSCPQAWRWNLDYVLDPHGNAVGYFYTPEGNKYGHGTARTAVAYTRGGTLAKITYGFQDGQAFGTPAAQVVFTVAERCKTAGATCTPTAANAGNYPDVPLDQLCTASTCGTTQTAPTFWSTKRLTGISAQAWKGAYVPVDTWSLGHDFPVAGDPPTTGAGSASLWLDSIQHSGVIGGTATTPPMTFDGTPMPNRVDGLEGLPPLNKFRLTTVRTESGGQIDVNYAPTNCVRTSLPTQDTNTQRCFPSWWTPSDQVPLLDWFHKYVVARVLTSDRVTDQPTMQTDYDYDNAVGGAWHFTDTDEITPAAKRTWSQWRGYQKVTVTQGTGQDGPRTSTSNLYLRGMDGDKLTSGTRSATVPDSQGGTITDAPAYAGFVREQITTNGVGGAEVSGQINDPVQSAATATHTHDDGLTVTARLVNTAGERGRVRLANGTFRRTQLNRVFDSHGQPTQLDDQGDLSTATDDMCTRTSYASNETKWMWSYPREVATVGVACAATPSYPADAVTDVRSYYDLSTTLGALPGAGDVTRSEQAASYSGNTPTFAPLGSGTYDAFGRPLSTKDALGRETKTAYTDTGGLTTQTAVTDPALFVTTTTLEPAWGVPTIVVDPNNKKTELAYDPLGRLISVWKPSRPRASFDPTQTFAYSVHNDVPTTVTSSTLGPNGRMRSTFAIYDGLLRVRQTQSAAVGAGRVLTDTTYNSAGQTFRSNGPYVTAGTAGTALSLVDDNQVPTQTLTQYDGAGRPTASIFQSLGVEQWRSSTAYGGDHVDVTPPTGGTAKSTYTDVRGRTTELRQYHGAAPSGAFDATRYTYTDASQLATTTDPAGNIWRFGYDLRGRRTSTDDPDKGHASATYDDAGQTLTSTDSRNRTLAYSYDALGRKTGEFDTSTSGTKLAGWTYDTLRKGALTSASRFVGTAQYTNAVLGYTADGLPGGATITIPDTGDGLNGTYTYRLDYKVDGSLEGLTLPITPGLPNESLTYQYDDLGNQSVLESGQPVGIVPFVPAALYTQLGKPARLTLSTGPATAWLSYYYQESTQRLTRSLVETGGNPVPTSDTNYKYDPAGNVTRVDTTIQGGQTDTQCFNYDYLRRLTEAFTATVATDATCPASPSTGILGGPAPYWQSYGYDLTGNRTTETRHDPAGGTDTTRSYTYPAAGQPQPHTVRSVDTAGPGGPATAAYGYDVEGNTTARPGGQALSYDIEGHLASVTQGTATSTYLYDADGARLISHDPTGATLYMPFGVEVHVDTAGVKSSTRYYTFAGLTFAMRTTAGVSFLASDPHGTSTQTVAASNAAVATRRLDPFGNPRGAQPTWPGNHGFVNGPTDPTGLTHLGAREYDQTIGRFTSVDPLLDPLDPQQLNGFAYANNSPVVNADPTGLMSNCGPDNFRCGGDPNTDPATGKFIGKNSGGGPGAGSSGGAARPGKAPPEVDNADLRKTLANIYARPGELVTVGEGKTGEALIHEKNTGIKVGSSPNTNFHYNKAADMLNRLSWLLQAHEDHRVVLSARDEAVVRKEIKELVDAIRHPDVAGKVTEDMKDNPGRANAYNTTLEKADWSAIREFSGTEWTKEHPKAPWRMKGASGLAPAMVVINVVGAYSAYRDGGPEAAFLSVVDPLGVTQAVLGRSPCYTPGSIGFHCPSA